MKKLALSISIGITALGLLGLGTTNVRAASATNVLISTFALSGLYSPTNSSVISNASGTVITMKMTTKPLKVTNKDLLNLLATEFGTTFPAGAQLAMQMKGDSGFVVLDKSGAVLLDVSTNPADTSYVFSLTNYVDTTVVNKGHETMKRSATDTNVSAAITMIMSDETLHYADKKGNDFHFTGVFTLNEAFSQDPGLHKTNVVVSAQFVGSGGGVIFNPADSSRDKVVFPSVSWKCTGKNMTSGL